MKIRSVFTSIALSSVTIATGTLEISRLDQNPIFAAESSRQAAPPSKSMTSRIYIAQSNNSLASSEQAVHDQINKYRATKGLSPLTLDPRISEQARSHSQNMANGAVPFSHDGFDQRVQTIAKVIPYSAAAENVAYNQGYSDLATQAVQGWIKSITHRTNIEGQYNLTGIGVAKNHLGAYYFTQIFIRSR